MKAKELTKIRDGLNLSMRELARRLGVTHASISYYESGQQPIPLNIEKKLQRLVFQRHVSRIQHEQHKSQRDREFLNCIMNARESLRMINDMKVKFESEENSRKQNIVTDPVELSKNMSILDLVSAIAEMSDEEDGAIADQSCFGFSP